MQGPINIKYFFVGNDNLTMNVQTETLVAETNNLANNLSVYNTHNG